MNVAMIPARGGSKRIPKKNVRSFVGRPMIAYSIQAAKESGVFDRIIVSTDSEEIARIAQELGAECPFIRPPELSDDHVATAPVLEHTLRWLERLGQSVQYACCIYATAPFVRSEDIRLGLGMLQRYACQTSFSVTSFEFPIFRAHKLTEGGTLEMFWPEHELTRSQDLPEAYHDAGQFYWVDVARFMKDPRLYAPDSRPVILPRHLVQDIDTLEDWQRAELMFMALNSKQADAQ